MYLTRALAAILLVALCAGPSPALAGLPDASAAAMGIADTKTALVRGFASLGVNPAGLGMPETPKFTLALVGAGVRSGLGPVSMGDLNDYSGVDLPVSVKQSWLDAIATTGQETGAAGADVTWLAVTRGSFGLQASTAATGEARLNEDAAELILFGNAGRTGEPRDFQLGDSFLDGAALTSFAVSGAIPLQVTLGSLPDQAMALGVSVKYTVGHFVALARNDQSAVDSDPVRVDFRFPTLVTDTEAAGRVSGSGFGLDVGGAWRGGPLAVGLSVLNLYHSFSWDESKLKYTPAQGLFDGTTSTTDFDTRPAAEAPEFLRQTLRDYDLDPQLAMGLGYSVSRVTTLTADFKHQFGSGIQFGPRTRFGVGGEFRVIPALPLRTGLAAVSGGFQWAGGVGLSVGWFNAAVAVKVQRGDQDAELARLTLSFGGQ